MGKGKQTRATDMEREGKQIEEERVSAACLISPQGQQCKDAFYDR